MQAERIRGTRARSPPRIRVCKPVSNVRTHVNRVVCCVNIVYTMMFNGLLLCGDSDASDATKDSAGTCSLGDSGSGSCDAARAHYYHNKLLSTLQIVQNKEETIRVQAESLAVAEARISELSTRAAGLRTELDRKTKEVHSLRKDIEHRRLEKTDASVIADAQEAEKQSDVIKTLRNNLGVIEDLYRECFYETAKQESLIDMLRESYLDVRLKDKKKAEQIGRLQNVINSHKFSLESCQDLALEVDSLKMDISNFLSNSTNNDSGMWEVRSETLAAVPGVQDDLQDIMEQLLRLREMLAGGCICGLQEENVRLKKSNESMEIKIDELRRNINTLQSERLNKDCEDARYKQEIELKEKELLEIRCKLVALEEGTRDQSSACDTLTVQLQQMQALLDDKTAELTEAQERCEKHESTISQLREELGRADRITKEVSLWRAQLADSERHARALAAELQRARAHCAHLDDCYRQKVRSADALQTKLEEAHARGEALCEETRRAVSAVREWARRMRTRHREQEAVIRDKETLIATLRQRVEERQSDTHRTTTSENDPSCSKCCSSRNQSSRGSRELSGCCPKSEKRRLYCGTSGSEMASCSTAPVPPRRLLRKKLCISQRCGCGSRNVSVQEPVRCEASTGSEEPSPCCTQYESQQEARHLRVLHERLPRDISPTEELFLRVEQLSEALADGQRRWTRGRDER